MSCASTCAARKRYPLVLMLEPLFRCNLACAGCGKIDYPDEILNQRLSVDECLARGRRMRRAGGLDRRRRAAAAQGIAADRRRHHRAQEVRLSLHQCAAAGKEASTSTSRARISPGRCISTATRQMHDKSVCQDGVYDRAVAAIKAAKARGFRVNINCTLFNGADPERVARFFDDVMAMGVDGITVSPGYAYERAPDQQHFLNREQDQAAVPRHLQRAATAARTGRSASPACSSTSSPATRPITARRGATRRAPSSAGSGPATCSAKATPRPSRS